MFRPGNLINGEDPTSLIRSFMPTPVHQSDNLRVPTTPLKDHVEETNNNEVNQFMPSKIPMAIPSSSSSVRLDTPSPLIENIVATCFLGLNVNLKHVALHARNAEYNPKRFAAVIMRIREPRTTALIFNSGKMVITGAKSEEASKLAARKFARIIQKLGFDAKFLDFKIQNLVAAVDVHFAIFLEGLNIAHSQFSTYEPEIFPGLIYRMVKPRVVLLIFVSGKIVVTGARKREEIMDAFNQIYPILKGFKK